MKVEMNSKFLQRLVGEVSSVIGAKNIRPDGNWVQLEAEGDMLKAHAVNDACGVSDVQDCTVMEEGSCIVDGNMLAKVISGMANGEVTLSSDEKQMTIKSGTNRSKIALVGNAEEMPQMHDMDGGSTMDVEATTFAGAMADVRYAVSTDSARMILTGVYVNPKDNGEMDVVGLDGYRLAMATMTYDGEEMAPFIIPSASADKMIRLFGKSEGYLTMSVNDGRLFARNGGLCFETVLLEGQYIDYTRILPKSEATKVTVKASDYKNALTRASLLADEKNKIVKLEVNASGEMILRGSSVYGASEDTVEANVEGESIQIAFNSRYLSECAKNLYGEYIVFGCTTKTSPVLFVDGMNKHICLPVRVLE